MRHKKKRPAWDKYFLEITKIVSRRSTCLRRKVGAIIVKNKRILSTGYNGAPSGIVHCEEVGGCLREQLKIPSGQRHELCRGLHAEQNAIIQAAVHGVSIRDATLYCTDHPCTICVKIIINADIKEIVISSPYPDEEAKKLLKEAGVKVHLIKSKLKT